MSRPQAHENIDYLVCRPEPAIDQFGEEFRFVATIKVAFPGGEHYEGEMDGDDHHDDKDGDDCDGGECDDDNCNRPS